LVHLLACLLIATSLAGCDPAARPVTSPPGSGGTAEQPAEPISLKLLVLDDEGLAEEIGRHWNAEDRGQLTVEKGSLGSLQAGDWQLAPDIDLVVFPLGIESRLIDAGQLVAVPDFVLESPDFARSGLLTHYRSRFAAWQGQFWSLPLGSVPFLLLHHSGLKLDVEPEPLTWTAVDQALKSSGDVVEGARGIVYPDAGNWLAWSLFARAVPLFRSSAEPGGLFVPETMEPLIDSPPFVRALEEMAATAIPPGDSPRTPADVFRMVASGAAAAGLGWPDADFQSDDVSGDAMAIQRLPGSESWYSRRESDWQARLPGDSRQYDLVHVDGRAVAVTSASLHAGEAFELAAWLSGSSSATGLSSRSTATGPFRTAQLENPAVWTGTGLPTDQAANWSSAIRQCHASGMPFLFPGVKAPDEYLAALAAAVRRKLEGSASAEASLSQAAEEWRLITARIGVAQQKANLRRHGY
jgi:hypothetical protein